MRSSKKLQYSNSHVRFFFFGRNLWIFVSRNYLQSGKLEILKTDENHEFTTKRPCKRGVSWKRSHQVAKVDERGFALSVAQLARSEKGYRISGKRRVSGERKMFASRSFHVNLSTWWSTHARPTISGRNKCLRLGETVVALALVWRRWQRRRRRLLSTYLPFLSLGVQVFIWSARDQKRRAVALSRNR